MFKRGFFIFALTFFVLVSSLISFVPKTSAANLDYNYDLVYQSPNPDILNPGQTISVSLEIENTGTATWENTDSKVVRLGAGSQFGSLSQQKDYSSEFAASDWLSSNRPASISSEVKPGEEATFQFNIKAPLTPGTYKAYFTPVVDGSAWMKDLGIYWQITVQAKESKISSTASAQTNSTQTSVQSQNEKKVLPSDSISDEIAPSIVKLICKTSTDFWNQGSGTLFYNSTGNSNLPQYYVITNLHVAKSDNNSATECDIKLTPDYANPANYLKFESQGYKSFDGLDLAILEPKIIYGVDDAGSTQDLARYAKDDLTIEKKDSMPENIGEKMLVIGYPENGNLSVSQGKILGTEFYNGSKYIDTSAQLEHGNSGGLAINSDGQILGIPTLLKADGTGMILDINYLESKIY